MTIDPDGLARTALVEIIPRGRYRLAGLTDSRFADLGPGIVRIAVRQAGTTPSLVIFAGPDADAAAIARHAAAWAARTWRPDAIRKRVRPGVLVIQVGPQPKGAGKVEGADADAVVWTVDADSGRVAAPKRPAGAPSTTAIGRAARALLQGMEPAPLGALDVAEHKVMQVRGGYISRGAFGTPLVAILVVGIILRYGLGAVGRLLYLPSAVGSGPRLILTLVFDLILVAGLVLGAALLWDFRGIRERLPGFSSSQTWVYRSSWGGLIAVVLLAGYLSGATLGTTPTPGGAIPRSVHLTVNDDQTEVAVQTGGTVTVDLSDWPASARQGMHITVSNPSVLQAEGAPDLTGATFRAAAEGRSRISAQSGDGSDQVEFLVDVQPAGQAPPLY